MSRWLRRLVRAVALGGVGVFAAAVPLRAGDETQVTWLDVGVYGAVYVAVAVGLMIRPAVNPWRRWGWRLLGLAVLVNAAGNACFSLVVRRAPEPVYPSEADYLYLSWYVVAYAGILLLLRAKLPRLSPGLVLDALIAGLGVAAVVFTIALRDVTTSAGVSPAEIAVNLAYPGADLLLFVILAAGVAMMGRRTGLVELCLGAGLCLEAVADVVFLVQDAANQYVEGGWVDLLWLLGVVVMLAARELGERRGEDAPAPSAPVDARPAVEGLALPVGSSLVSAVLIGVHQAGHLPLAAAVMADASVLAALLRAGLSVRELRESRARELSVLHRQARTDELTGLPNRRAFYEACDGLLPSATVDRPVCLLLLDLDRFKEINDALGHSVGDQLLCEVAERVRGTLAPGEALARLGGDEFAVLVPGPVAEGRARGEAVLRALGPPFLLAGSRLHVEGSIGVACAPKHATERNELLGVADVAMYEAKRGRTRIAVYASAHGITGRERLRVEEELRGALAGEDPRRNGFLLVHLQPQLGLDERGDVVGAEALVRWQHPVQGLLLPGAFLPLARSAGLFDGLVDVVLGLALGACRRWWEAGWQVPVAVNVSASDLHGPAVVERIVEALDEHGLPERALIVEVTEETLMIDPDGAHVVLDQLRARGVRVSIDDFGSGYSSFAYLRTLPADELKLDAFFTQDIAHEPGEGSRPVAIVRTVADLAHSLGLRLVAEGIEDAASAARLHELGVDVGQGFHLARPMSPDRFLVWLDERRTGELLGAGPPADDPDLPGTGEPAPVAP